VGEAFAFLGDEIATKRKDMESESQQVINNISSTIKQLGEEIRHAQDFYGAAQNKNNEFSQAFLMVSQNLHEIENNLEKNVNNFSSKASNVFSQFNEVNKHVNGNIDKFIERAENISKQSKENADLLVTQDEFLNKTVDGLKQITANIADLNKGLHKTGNDIGTTLTKYEAKMSGFGKLISDHLDILQAGFQKTEKQMDTLQKKLKATSIDAFMRNSTDLINELETMSIDINSIFNKDKDEDLWKKYYAGDHTVFARYLAKNMTKKQIEAIQKNYESKSDFRILVDKYIDDFTSLIGVARENERAGSLLALISGSDIGKVYYILARALGKVN
jgi:predicted  nucleic acid-binding Zn-ribbon protein